MKKSLLTHIEAAGLAVMLCKSPQAATIVADQTALNLVGSPERRPMPVSVWHQTCPSWSHLLVTFSKSRLLRQGLKIAVGLALVAYLLSRIELSEVRSALSRTDPFLVLLAFLLFGVSRLFDGRRLHLLIRKFGFKVREAVEILMVSMFFNNLSTSVVGDGYEVLALRKKIDGWKTPVALVIIERTAGLVSIGLVGSLYAVVSPDRLPKLQFGRDIGTLAPVLAAAVLALAAACFVFRKNLVGYAASLAEGLRHLRTGTLLRVLFMTILAHLAISGQVYFVVRALGSTLPLWDVLLVSALVFVASYVPITIGSLGVREGAIVLALAYFRVSPPVATAAALLLRLILYVYASVGGILFLRVRRRVEKAESHRTELRKGGGMKKQPLASAEAGELT